MALESGEGCMIEQLAERAAARAMNPVQFLQWRNTLRQDYQQAFDPPPRTAMSWPVATLVLVLVLVIAGQS